MGTLKNIVLTFIIGLIAGISPFLFVQWVPVLLNPSLELVRPHYGAVILTGLLLGAITSIIFAKDFDNSNPKDVFFYALGIPAVLIATVSNISTKFEATQRINNAQIEASNTILNPVSPQAETVPLTEIPTSSQPVQKSFLSPAHALAEQSLSGGLTTAMVAAGYVVVLGRFDSQEDAVRMLRELEQRKLKTELYFPKNLRIFKTGSSSYYVSYSTLMSQQDAEKLYKLIRINDPDLTPEILRQK
ncbi:MAG: hypothetical protein HY581_01410 [Nitrospirae bacterium]|nr:hypothetical protein [Nitrospirota bacterium]